MVLAEGDDGFGPASSFHRQGGLERGNDLAALCSHTLLEAACLRPVFPLPRYERGSPSESEWRGGVCSLRIQAGHPIGQLGLG